MALVMCGTGAGSIIPPPLAQWLIDFQGWRAAYMALGLMALVCGIPLTLLFVRERPGSGTPAGVSAPIPGWSASEGPFAHENSGGCDDSLLNSLSVNGAITHLSALPADHGISKDGAALALSVLRAARLFGRLIRGLLLDRFFGRRVSFFLLSGSAAGIAFVAPAHTLASALTVAVLICIGLGGDITPYLLTRYLGRHSFSTLYSFTWTTYAIAGAIGPVVMGGAFEAPNLSHRSSDCRN